MKRLGLLLAILCMFGIVANAQQDFQKGNCYFNAGVGIGYGLPISVSAEWAVAANMIKGNNGAIGVGAYLDFNPLIEGNIGFNIAARADFHYQWVEKLDTYAGIGLGFFGRNNDGDFRANPHVSAFVGARYYFWNKIGLYAEAGGGLGLGALSIGACFKF